MAWNKSTWQDVIGTEISKSTVTFGNSVTGVINTNLASPLKFLNLSIRCEVLFGGTPDGNAEIKVYGRDVLGGDESDTIPIYRQDIEFVTSDSQIITLPNIDTSSIDSLQIEVLNKDSTDSIDVWVSFMYGYIDTVAGSSPDETVKISYNDTTKDYLENKLVGEFGVIELTVLGEAAFETYKISLNSTKLSNWDTAYGWGDHSVEGYLKSFIETDPIFSAWLAYPPALSEFTNDVGYLTAETDPDFNSWLSGVTPANWDAAYGWGDHSVEGYLKSFIEVDPVFIAWLSYPPALSEFTNDLGYLTAETDPDFNSWLSGVTPANWDSAYGWGDHSIQGYLKSFIETDPIFAAWLSYPPSLSEFTNDLGYLTAETDPDFNSWLSGVTPANWDSAYGWGDHSIEGYLKSYIETDPVFIDWLSYPPALSEFTNDLGYLTVETDPDFNSWLGTVTPANWDSAYGWGDHSIEGYLKVETDPIFIAWLSYPPSLSEFTNDMSFLTAETDPDFNSWLSGVTPANWDAAYGWGDHSIEGYLKSFTETDPIAMAINTNTKEPTGFIDRTSSIISFTDGTMEFKIDKLAPATEFKYYVNGVLYTKSAACLVNILDTEGLWYIYFNNATLTAVYNAHPGFDKALVSTIYWDATNNKGILICDERHGCTMSWSIHEYLHDTIGARFASGLALTGSIVGDGDTNSHAQVSIDNGEIFDEDLSINITDGASGLFVQDISPIAKIPVFWRSGVNGDWRMDTATDYPVKQGAARIQYNLYTGGSWSATDITSNGKYGVMWILATNDISHPIIAILGQGDYGTLLLAQNAGYSALSLEALPTAETKVIYKLIFQTSSVYANVPKARLREITDYRQTSTGPVGASVITNHNSLSGRSDASVHPSESIDTTVTNFNNILTSADTTVQKALETIDNFYQERLILAEEMQNPNNADWVVNVLAPLSADDNNNGLNVRLFDDTVNEGIGFNIFVPLFATNIVLKFKSRAITAPAGTKKVDLGLYFRTVPDNAAVDAWSAKKDITGLISIPTNEYFQYDTTTLSLATLGITSNRYVQFEIVRDAADEANDDLVGDWALLSMRVLFT